MNIPVEEKLEEDFHISWYIVVYKFLFGVIEFISGAGLAFFGSRIFYFYTSRVHQELSEEPNDLLARMSERIVPNLFTHRSLISIYLIVLGAAKIAGAIGLMNKQTWGVDLLVGLTLIMLPFQLQNFVANPSLPDFLFILIGLFIALYLVNYKPKEWAKHMVRKIRQRNVTKA